MRAAFRNTIAAAVAAAIAVSGANVAHAQQDVELAPVLTNTTTQTAPTPQPITI